MTARNRVFPNDQGKRLHDRSVGVLRDGQENTVVLLRRSFALATVMIMIALMFAAAITLSLNLGDMMLGRSGQLLEKVMYAVRRGRSAKKPKSNRDAQAQAAAEFRDWLLGIYRQHRRYRNRTASRAQAPLLCSGGAI